MAGQKPDLKIALKPKDGGGDRVYFMAFWRRENGKLSGDVDRKLRGMRLFMEDGSHVDVKRGADGKLSHWLDVFEGDAMPQQGRSRQASASNNDGAWAGRGGNDDLGSDDLVSNDFGDDQIPF